MVERENPRDERIPRRRLLAAAAVVIGGGIIGTGTYFLEKYLGSRNQLPTTPLPLGVTGQFVNLQDGDSVHGDIFTFGVNEQIRVPGTLLQALEATMWYAEAIPDKSENPHGGWVRADIATVNTRKSGIHNLSINMNQPKPDQPPVPNGQFSLSINARGRRPDGNPGQTNGAPGPINLFYRRTTASIPS